MPSTPVFSPCAVSVSDPPDDQVHTAQLAGLELEPNGSPQRGGVMFDPNGHHVGNDLDPVGLGMEIGPTGAPWFGPTGDPGGTMHGGGLDIEPTPGDSADGVGAP